MTSISLMTAQEMPVANANLCCQAPAALPSTGALFGKRSHWATGNESRMNESLQPVKLGRGACCHAFDNTAWIYQYCHAFANR
jgi:hypothetical protein